MIRHSSSFIVSLILHALVVMALFFAYTSVPKKKIPVKEKRVEICLGSLSSKTPQELITKAIVKKVPIPKITPKEIKPILKKKKKKKNIIKKVSKAMKKKILPAKQVVIIEDTKEVFPILKVPETTKETTKETIEIQEENFVQSPQIQETKLQKASRLEQEYISQHIKKITQLLSENLYYPRSARRRNIQDDVIVEFKLSPTSEVSNIKIISSKSEILARAAMKTIQNLSNKFPSPAEELVLRVPISYTLRQ